MKKSIGILLLSVFCFFGTKEAKLTTVITGGSGKSMEVYTSDAKWVNFYSDHGDIWFNVPAAIKGKPEGTVKIGTYNDRDEDYKRLQKMMNEIKSKTKMTVDYTQSECDGNGIIYDSSDSGKKIYSSVLIYKVADIYEIYVY